MSQCAVLVILHICPTSGNLFSNRYSFALAFACFECYFYFDLLPLLTDMATKTKRLPLTLDPELGQLIAEIAELRGIKQTRVVTELLEECKPQFIAIRDALIAVKNNEPNPQAILNKMFANSFKNLGDVFEDLSNH